MKKTKSSFLEGERNKRIKENRAKSYPQLTATRCSEMKKGVAVKKVLQ